RPRGLEQRRAARSARTPDPAATGVPSRRPTQVRAVARRREEMRVKRLADRAAGLDVHRDNVVAATRINEPSGEVSVTKKRFPTTRRGIGELAAFLTQAGVTRVAMEATGVYWKPVYYSLEGLFDELWLCNAQHVKNVPGRKTDLTDAEWLADVAAHGLVRPRFRR